MRDSQRQFWESYIEAIGPENFSIRSGVVRSKFYCGVDLSALDGVEDLGPFLVDRLISRHNQYQDILQKGILEYWDLGKIFSSIVSSEWFDTELVFIIRKRRLRVDQRKYMDMALDLWSQQEFKATRKRKSNWKRIFSFRPEEH